MSAGAIVALSLLGALLMVLSAIVTVYYVKQHKRMAPETWNRTSD